jgi:hypothetical protein
MRPLSRLIAGLAVIAVAVVAPSAAQAVGWVASGPIGPSDAVDPQVVITPDGGRVIAYSEPGPGGGVTVRSAPPGGDFGASRIFPGPFDDPQLAVGTDGTVALAWRDNTAHTVHIARRPPGQEDFTEATPFVAVTQFPVLNVSNLGLVVTGGDAYLTFQSAGHNTEFNQNDVWVTRLAADGNALLNVGEPNRSLAGLIVPLADQSSVNSPQIAVDRGTPVVVYQDQSFATRAGFKGQTFVQVESLDGSTFKSAAFVTLTGTTGAAPFAPPAVAAGGGHAYVAWPRDANRLAVMDLSDSAVTQTISSDVQFQGNPRLAADHSGTLYAAWEGTAPGVTGPVTVGTVVPFGDAPPKAVRLASPGRLDDLAVARDGSAVALTDSGLQANDPTADVHASLSSHGAPFAPAEDVTGQQPTGRARLHQAAAAVAPGGRLLTLWPSSGGLELSERDVAAPVFGAVDVPPTATVGQPIAVAATATDNLSGATIRWDFGDGAKADGGSASHAFATPGDMQVTVTATDSEDNSVTLTRTVTVQAPPAPAPVPVPVPPGTSPPGPVIPPPGDRTPPSITRVSLTHTRFKLRTGTAFRLSLSEKANVSIAIAHGRTAAGTLTRKNAGPGKLSVAFNGKLGRKALKPGSYTASITATDAAGNRSKVVHVKFTVVKG